MNREKEIVTPIIQCSMAKCQDILKPRLYY